VLDIAGSLDEDGRGCSSTTSFALWRIEAGRTLGRYDELLCATKRSVLQAAERFTRRMMLFDVPAAVTWLVLPERSERNACIE
jgi:hypothetical protein